MFKYIFQDRLSNKNNTKGKLIAVLFRTAAYLSSVRYIKILFSPYFFFYRFFVEWVLGIELPRQCKIGAGLMIYHGQSLIVNKDTVIGQNCILRHCTTIGNAAKKGKSPVIGDNVDIGANVCILGDITIGNNVIIGAGSVVVKSIPPNSLAVGNPAKVIRSLV